MSFLRAEEEVAGAFQLRAVCPKAPARRGRRRGDGRLLASAAVSSRERAPVRPRSVAGCAVRGLREHQRVQRTRRTEAQALKVRSGDRLTGRTGAAVAEELDAAAERAPAGDVASLVSRPAAPGHQQEKRDE